MAVSTQDPLTTSSADQFMLRLLRLPADTSGTEAQARTAFQQSIVISSVRCLLTYVIFPFVVPTVGFLARIGPALGILVSVVAIASITISMRRFWRVRHGQRWVYTGLASVMLVFIAFLLVRDLAAL